jgi:general secretion pathway protein J
VEGAAIPVYGVRPEPGGAGSGNAAAVPVYGLRPKPGYAGCVEGAAIPVYGVRPEPGGAGSGNAAAVPVYGLRPKPGYAGCVGGAAIPVYGLRPKPGYGDCGVRAAGFTLMETLVMLLLVSLATAMMFQMLGSYRVARERFLIQGEQIDTRELSESWFADSVRGLHPVGSQPLSGTVGGFESVTINPLFGPRGTAAEIGWLLEQDTAGTWVLAYSQGGSERFAVALPEVERARFVFIDSEGAVHDGWPPALGEQSGLPGAVAIERTDYDGRRSVRVASVLGHLVERIDRYESEEF